VWQFYVTSFAHSAIQDHILGVVHGGLLALPWDRFWPSMQDLEFMLKVQKFLSGMLGVGLKVADMSCTSFVVLL
jgi:hypothetical protein